MRLRALSLTMLVALLGAWGALRAQKPSLDPPRPFKQYDAAEYEDFPLPANWQATTEWTRARLHYSSTRFRRRG